ncbi:hypothetical protein NDU88_002607 [Pleurodeles waltl]|uniref:Uncharacterized protein n=1 Tax=Pleurodeles waltl TaxID=8319 RepID=A0AAV7P762_PLEWA|nr:hypothetical protein NDU88_002607 [Pleurodeles waltl]
MVRSDELRTGRRGSTNYRCKEGLLCDRNPELAYVRGLAEWRAQPRRDWLDTLSEQTDSESGVSNSAATEKLRGPVITHRTVDEL